LSKKKKKKRKKRRGLLFCLGFLGNFYSLPPANLRAVGYSKKVFVCDVFLCFRHHMLLLILRSRCCHGFFFDLFRPCPSVAMSSAFHGTNYRDWVPRMRLHMRGLRLLDFLTGELPCLPHPSAPAESVIIEKTIAAKKEKLLADYEDRMASYES
jgi:hypothetical protein